MIGSEKASGFVYAAHAGSLNISKIDMSFGKPHRARIPYNIHIASCDIKIKHHFTTIYSYTYSTFFITKSTG